MVITIDYLDSLNLGKDQIQFSGLTEGFETDKSETTQYFNGRPAGNHNKLLTDATIFVHNIQYLPSHGKNEEWKRIFTADKLTMEKAKQMFYEGKDKDDVPLFFVHGFDNEPVGVLNGVRKAKKSFDAKDSRKRCQIIPVLWPNTRKR